MFVTPFAGPSVNTPPPTPAVVTLTAHQVFSVSAGGVSNARLHIVADGTMWRQTTHMGSQQINAATDWIIPNLSAPDSSYEVRYINLVTQSLPQFSAFAAENVWVDLSESRFLQVYAWPGGIYRTATFDLEIRKDGGAVLATASFTLTASKLL